MAIEKNRIYFKQESPFWNALVVHWLGLHAFTDEEPGSIPSWETKLRSYNVCILAQNKTKTAFFQKTPLPNNRTKKPNTFHYGERTLPSIAAAAEVVCVP